MSKIYHAVPIDEEQSRSSSDTIYEKDSVAIRHADDRFERDPRTRVLDFLTSNWTWLAHTILLSSSLVLFTLSFCQRTATARITDLEVTQQYASYCMAPPLAALYPPLLTVTAPVAPIVKYETVRYNLTPLVEGPFVGYGVDVDEAWDSIANDSRSNPVSVRT